MRLKITRKGVRDGDGNDVPVGTTIRIEGDKVPAWLVNKAEVIGRRPENAEEVLNQEPETEPDDVNEDDPDDDDPADDDAAAAAKAAARAARAARRKR